MTVSTKVIRNHPIGFTGVTRLKVNWVTFRETVAQMVTTLPSEHRVLCPSNARPSITPGDLEAHVVTGSYGLLPKIWLQDQGSGMYIIG